MLTVAWVSNAPDWDSVTAAVAGLIAFVGLEVTDTRRQKGLPTAHVEHDRTLFRRYEEILSERRLVSQLTGDLYAHRTRSEFTTSLYEYLRLASLGEGQFLVPAVQKAFSDHADHLGS